MNRRTEPTVRGIVLLLISGVVTMLVLLSLAILQSTRIFGARAAAQAGAAQAALAAASGMDYAAARLSRERTYPRFSTSSLDRGDDWTDRQGSGIRGQGSENPSYSHGEGWVDKGTPDGHYTPADVRGEDRDGDGAFSAWSGRVRGAGTPFATRFSLGIGSVGGRIPVNAAPTLSLYQKGLSHILNNLGAVLFPDDGSRPWRRDVAAGVPLGAGEAIRCSRLGDDLFALRPAAGYASLAAVDAALGSAGYAEADRARILPFLDTGPYAAKVDGGRPEYPYVPIELATAPVETLRSVWQYLRSLCQFCPGEPATFDNYFRRSGPANLTFTQTSEGNGGNPLLGIVVTIFPEEAEAIAAEADALRRGGGSSCSWKALRDRLVARAGTIFASEAADLGADFVNPSTPAAQAAWVRAKADLAYFAVSPAPPPYEDSATPQVWNTLGADFDIPPALPTQPMAIFLTQYVKRIRYPDTSTWTWAYGGNTPYWEKNFADPEEIHPEGLTTAPPSQFRVRSLGTAPLAEAAFSGVLRAAERIDLSTQEDFENLANGALLEAAAGIRVEDPSPTAKRAALADPGSGRFYPQVSSIPGYNPSWTATPAYSRHAGGLTLAGRECGALGAGYYWPFSEDLDGDPSDDFPSESADGRPPVLMSRTNGGPHFLTRAFGNVRLECPGMDNPGPFSWGVGPYIEAFSVEAWMMPGLLPRFTVGNNIEIQARGENWVGATLRIRALRDVQGGMPGHLFEFYVKWLLDGPFSSRNRTTRKFVPDYDPATGKAQSGFHHVAMTFKRYLYSPPSGYRTKIRCYVDGEEVVPGGEDFTPFSTGSMAMPTRPEWIFAFQRSDELRLYATELSPADVRSRFEMGRFVPPQAVPVPDPRTSPGNPTYRSPRYVLRGGAVRWASWTAWTTPEIASKAAARVLLYGLDAAGDEVWRQALPAAGPWEPLPDLPLAHSLQYVVEFYSPSGAPAPPLFDTPFVGPVSFWVLSPGRAPAWGSWESR